MVGLLYSGVRIETVKSINQFVHGPLHKHSTLAMHGDVGPSADSPKTSGAHSAAGVARLVVACCLPYPETLRGLTLGTHVQGSDPISGVLDICKSRGGVRVRVGGSKVVEKGSVPWRCVFCGWEVTGSSLCS